MNAQHNNLVNTSDNDNGLEEQTQAMYREEAAAYAETLLDQVEAAQDQIQCLNDDISLLQTLENALDLVGENLSKIWCLIKAKQDEGLCHSDINSLDDTVSNLLMINMLIVEETEFGGHHLFRDKIIQLNNQSEYLYLTTSRIPEIIGIETSDFDAIFDSLSAASRTINRQYKRIGEAMQILLDEYRNTRDKIDKMLTAQAHLKQ